jgi:hypothetical protein
MVEATIPHGFSGEADALYSRPGYNSIFQNAFVSSTNKARHPNTKLQEGRYEKVRAKESGRASEY